MREIAHDHIDTAASSAIAAVAHVVAKNAPPVAVVGLSLAGVLLQEWVYIVANGAVNYIVEVAR